MTKMKRLNLFKSMDNRTPEDVRLQRIITRIYLVLLAGMSVFLFRELPPGGYATRLNVVECIPKNTINHLRGKARNEEDIITVSLMGCIGFPSPVSLHVLIDGN